MKKIVLVFAFLSTFSFQSSAQWIDLSANLPDSIENISDIYFLSEEIGLISCKNQSIWPNFQRYIYRTTNGGETWIVAFHDVANQQENYKFNFINSDTGWAFSSNALIKTIDGGQSWVQLNVPVVSFPKKLTIHSTHFIDNNVGWAGGVLIFNDYPYLYQDDVIYKTTDGGANWINQLQSQAVMGVHKISFTNGNIGWATNSENFYKTTNSGGNWVKMNYSLHNSDFDFTDQSNGWAIYSDIYNSLIFKTSNGGNNWFQQYANSDTSLNDLFFTNSFAGFCVGDHGKILITSDSGINWKNKNIGVECNLQAISFVTEQFGYCGGQNYLFKTTNGGVTFIEDGNNITQPKEFMLEQNHPNPFNPSTSIQYSISNRQFVSLKVYNVLGKEIATLVNEEKSAGSYNVEFNASHLASGVYIYTLRANGYSASQKMLLLK